jgi:uncharacterized protein YkwD
MKKQTHTTKGLKPPKKHLTKTHAQVYWPYLPLLFLIIAASFFNIWKPLQPNNPETLAYATEMSTSGLLSATNSQRASNGAGALTINSKLNAAAQAKANDMVARDYWSHNTPDGQEPWVFIDAQGYSYTKAGENLAYGFSTSNSTIIGWMNSASHRANMLDTTFTEVGFGFANSANFVGTGNETIVVAHYAKPPTPPAPQPAAAAPAPPASTPQTAPATTQKTPTAASPVETEDTPAPPIEIKEDTVVESNPQEPELPITTDTVVPATTETKRITILQQFTGGKAPWSAVALSVMALALAGFWIFKHAITVRKIIIEGEHFVAHHPIFDVLVVSIIALAVYLSQASGVIL